MKRSREELNRAKEFLNDTIKLGIQMNLEKESDEPILTADDLDRMNIPQPPADMYERIMKQIRAGEKKTVKKFRIKKVLLVAAIITTFLISALSVQAVRLYIYKIGVQIMENGANLIGINIGEPDIFDVEDDDAYAQAESELGHKLLKPTYLPKGVKFQEIKVYGDSKVRLLFCNDDSSKIIRFNQEVISGELATGTILDTKNPIVFQDTINKYEVTIGEKTQDATGYVWLIGFWNDDEMLYTIDVNIGKEDLIQIIKNLK
jgi:hypothetical protein